MLLGNLLVKQIEYRLGVTFSDEDRSFLNAHHQARVDIHLEDEAWHCFDIPFVMLCGTKSFAEKILSILKKYEKEMNEKLQICWERKNDGT